MQAIATKLENYYQQKHPEIYQSKQLEVRAAIAEVQRIFRSSIFPEMKVDWRVHANNIGHFTSAGCFRCHDGNHTSSDNKVVSKQCDVCHTVIAEVMSGQPVYGSAAGIPFKHPVDIGDITQVNCSDCHNGGIGP
jgi:hypothetical protein